MKKLLFLIFFVFVSCVSANKVVTAVDKITLVSGNILISVYLDTYKWVNSAEGTKAICEPLLKEHEAGIKDGSYTEEDLKRDCLSRVRSFEEQFDKALTIAADSLRTVEHANSVAKAASGIGKEDAIKRVLDSVVAAIKAVQDIKRVLQDFGVPIPELLDKLINSLANIADLWDKE
uniref:DUF5667 domain-containing protein n=1 Tax=Dictyoglomus turgidum TaxID=513050 RepID=A0A7C3WLY8_9BACT